MAGADVWLVDVDGSALESAIDSIERDLANGAEAGRWTAQQARAARERPRVAQDVSVLADAELIVEAVPERLDLN